MLSILLLTLATSLVSADPNKVQDIYGNINRRMDDFCVVYDTTSVKCDRCYTGYFVNKEGRCIKNDALCLKTNENGQCIQCYNTFLLIQGRCYYQSIQSKDSKLINSSDSLCAVWQNNMCTKCLQGSSFVNRICKIVDPFCQSYDEVKGQCKVCLRNFVNASGVCKKILLK